MKTWWIIPALAGVVTMAACAGKESDEGLVARAGDHDLTVDQTVQLLVDQENLPNTADVVKALADLWVDYTLLADEVARDSTLKDVDLEPLVRQQLEQEMIFQLRDSVVQVDTAISEDELRTSFEKESPDAKIHASHILLGFPDQATQAQRDSVRAEMEGIRQRAVAGESFSALARQYSQDPGSASQGGDLGTFGRGEMVKPFEDAAFALEPGQISDIVESPYGLHIIRLESRETPSFDSLRAQFRQRMQNQRYLSAESAYVAGLEEKADPQIADNAIEVAKELAKDPGSQLSSRAADRPMVSFQGGAFTVGDYQTFIQNRTPQQRSQIQNGTDEQLENFLNGLAQRELLVAEAKRAGLEPPRQRVDSLVDNVRQQLLSVADEIGLRKLDRAPGEALEPAVDRAVRQALTDILTGATNVVPLGPIGFQLRSQTATAVYDPGIGQVVLDVGRVRSTRSPSPSEVPQDTAGAGADTTGR